MYIRSLLVTTAAASAILLGAAGPASAATVDWQTTDDNPGAKLHYYKQGNKFKLCDVQQTDDFSAALHVVYTADRGKDPFYVYGPSEGCSEAVPLKVGADYGSLGKVKERKARVCLYKKSSPTDLRFCSESKKF